MLVLGGTSGLGFNDLLMPAGIGMLLRPLLDPFLTVLLVWYGLYVSCGLAAPPCMLSQQSVLDFLQFFFSQHLSHCS